MVQQPTPANCFEKCLGNGGLPGCVFAFRSTNKCVLYVDQRKVKEDPQLRAREDCEDTVRGGDDVFLLPAIKLETLVSGSRPLGQQGEVEMIQNYLPVARNRFLERVSGDHDIITNRTSFITFATKSHATCGRPAVSPAPWCGYGLRVHPLQQEDRGSRRAQTQNQGECARRWRRGAVRAGAAVCVC